MELEFKKAVDLYENDKLKDAKKICSKIYKKNPNHFDNLRLLNFIYFKNKDFSIALDFINKAIKINPNFAEAYNEQGNALNELKKLGLQKVFIIGGRSIYKIFFHLADYLHISFIHIITDEINEVFPISLDTIQLEFKKKGSEELSEIVTYTYWEKKIN